jgi:histidyl-tRNA synthetase
MAIQKPSIPKGTRDFTPEETAKRNYIFNTIRSAFESYGFQAIETPALEQLSTLMGKYGDEGDKLLFKILNSGDFAGKLSDQELLSRETGRLTRLISEKGLRYDLTVPFARYVVMHRNEIVFPFKRYQIQPVWRADRPQKGRYREFFQCDADVVGSDSLLNEVELLQLLDTVFNDLGIRVCIKLNNRKILAGLAQILGQEERLTDITVAIDKLDKIGLDNVRAELVEKGIPAQTVRELEPVLLLQGSNSEKTTALRRYLAASKQGLQGIEELDYILKQAEKLLKNAKLELDLSLARGLNYYTGCIIEVKALDAFFDQFRTDIVQTDFVEFVYGYGNVCETFFLSQYLSQPGQNLTVVEFDANPDAQIVEHRIEQLQQFYLVEQGIAAHNIGVALKKFPVTPFLGTISPPNRLNLVTFERKDNFVAVHHNVAGKRHCQVVTQSLLRNKPGQPAGFSAQQFLVAEFAGKVARIQNLEQQFIALVPVFAHQRGQLLQGRSFDGLKAVAFESGTYGVENIIAFGCLLGCKIAGTLGDGRFLNSHNSLVSISSSKKNQNIINQRCQRTQSGNHIGIGSPFKRINRHWMSRYVGDTRFVEPSHRSGAGIDFYRQCNKTKQGGQPEKHYSEKQQIGKALY